MTRHMRDLVRNLAIFSMAGFGIAATVTNGAVSVLLMVLGVASLVIATLVGAFVSTID